MAVNFFTLKKKDSCLSYCYKPLLHTNKILCNNFPNTENLQSDNPDRIFREEIQKIIEKNAHKKL